MEKVFITRGLGKGKKIIPEVERAGTCSVEIWKQNVRSSHTGRAEYW